MRVTVEQARALADRAMRAIGHDEGRGTAHRRSPDRLRAARRDLRRAGASGQHRRARDAHGRQPRPDPRGQGHSGVGLNRRRRSHRLRRRPPRHDHGHRESRASGVAIVGANNTWYTGMLSYYAEMAAARGLVSLIASNASPWVAPHGATEGRFGTNPICVGFPSADEPVIWDIGTSAIMHAEVKLADALGQQLPEGVAFDAAGARHAIPSPRSKARLPHGAGTRAPASASSCSCSACWRVVRRFHPSSPDSAWWSSPIRPDLLTSDDEFRRNVAAYAESVRGARPIEGGPPVRMPFDRSRAERQRRLAEDAIDVRGCCVFEACRDARALKLLPSLASSSLR